MSNKNLTPMQAAAATSRSLGLQLLRVYGCEELAAIAEGLALFLDEQAKLEQIPRKAVLDALEACGPEPEPFIDFIDWCWEKPQVVAHNGREYGIKEGKRRTLLALLGEGEMP